MPYIEDASPTTSDMPPVDFHKAFTDFDGWRASLPYDQQQAIDSRFKFTAPAELENERKRFLSVGYVAQKTGQDVESVSRNFENYFLPGYAQNEKGLNLSPADAPQDVGGFFDRVKGSLAKEQDEKRMLFDDGGLLHSAEASAYAEDKGGFAKWQAANKGKPGYDDAKEGKYFLAWQEASKHIGEALGPHRATIRNMVKSMQSQTGADETNGWAEYTHPEYALRELALNDPKGYQLALRALQVAGASAKKDAEKGIVQKSGESFWRTITNSVDGSMRTVQSIGAMGADAVGAKDAAAFSRADQQVRRDLQDLAQGIIDPARSQRDGWKGIVENGILGFAGSTPLMLGAKHPLGWAVMAGGFADDARQDFRQNGWTGAGAETAALFVGAASSAVEWLSEVAGNIPGVKQVLAKFGATAGSKWLTRMALNTLGRAPTEFAEEYAQDTMSARVQELAKALYDAVPARADGQSLNDVAANFWKVENSGALAIAVLPLAMLGAGISTRQEIGIAKADALTTDKTRMSALVGEDEANRIIAIEDGGQRLSELQSSFAKVQTDARVEFIKAVNRNAEVGQTLDSVAQAQQLGLLPNIRRDDKGWTLTYPDTAPIRVASREEAERVALAHLDDLDRQHSQAMIQVADEFVKMGRGNEAFEIQPQKQGLKDEVEVGRATEEEAARAAELHGQMFGLTPEEAKAVNLQVLGNNRAEMVENVRTYVSRIFGGGNVATVMHEGIHGRWRAGLESGHYTHAQGLMWVRMAEQAAGFTLLPANDADVTPAQLDEAITETAVADLIGRRKDGSHFSPGLISRGLASHALSERKQAKEVGKFRQWLQSWKAFWGQVFRRAKQMQKARAEGKIGEDFDLFLDDLMGADAQARHEGAVIKDSQAMVAEMDMPFSLGLLGNVRDSGSVQIKAGDISRMNHEDEGLDQGSEGLGTFRYRADNRTVYWWFSPDENKREAAVSAVERKGWRVDRHQVIGSGNMAIAHGASFSLSPMGAQVRMIREQDVPALQSLSVDPFAQVPAGTGKGDWSRAWNAWEASNRAAWRGVVTTTEGDIIISGSTDGEMKHTAKGEDLRLHYQAATQLPVLLKNSVLAAVEPNRKAKKALEEVHKRYAWMTFPDAKTRTVLLTVFRWDLTIPGSHDTAYSEQVLIEVQPSTAVNSGVNPQGSSPAAETAAENYKAFIAGIKPGHHWQGQSYSLAPSSAARDSRPLPPIQISAQQLQGDRAAMRKMVRDYITANLQGKTITNADTGWSIGFSSESKGEAVSKARRETAMRSALQLEKIVEQSVLLGDVSPEGERVRNTERFHYFAVPVEIDGKSAVAWFNVRKHLRGGSRTFYEFGLYEKTVQTSPGLGSGAQGTQTNTPTFGPHTTIADFVHEIKGVVPAAMKVEAAPSFSLAPRSLTEHADTQLAAKMKKPEFKEAFYAVARQRLAKMRDADVLAVENTRKQSSLNREAKMREALRRDELINAALDSLSPDQRQDYEHGLQALESHPLIRKMLYDNGKLLSPSGAKREGKVYKGEFEDMPWLPRQWFATSGGIGPDVMADNLGFDSVSAMWAALGNVVESTAKTNERYHKINETVKQLKADAIAQAKAETAEWLKGAEKAVPSPKERQMQALRMLDAILSAFPPEVRGKVGGFVKLASLGTDDARAKEITRRIEKLEQVVEDHARKHFGERIEKLFEKAAPKDKGGKAPKGKLGAAVHDLVSYAEAVGDMSDGELAGETARLAKMIEDAEAAGDMAKVSALQERQLVSDIMGNLAGMDSAELAAAHEWLKDTVADGRLAWKAHEETRLDELRTQQLAAKDDIGVEGIAAEAQRQLVAAAAAPRKEEAKGMARSIWSFEQTINNVLGRKSKLGARLVAWARKATNAKTDAITEKRKQFRDFMRVLFNAKNTLEWQRGLYELQDVNGRLAVSVTITEGSHVKDYTWSADDVRTALNDPAHAKTLGLSKKELARLQDEWDINQSLPAKLRRSEFTVEREEGKPVTATMNLSQLQALHLSMMNRQAKYQPVLEHWGYTPAVMLDVEAQLTDKAKALRAWLANEYSQGYDSLNDVFARMYGVNLPRLVNYAPGTFEGKDMMSVDANPFGDGMIPEGGMKAGMLKKRVAHKAKPRLEDALSVFWGHVGATEHFKHFAEFTRELRGTMNDAKVRASIDGKGGKGMLETVQGWLTAFEKNGVREREFTGWANKLLKRWASAKAYGALAFNFGTLLKQMPAALNTFAEIPFGEYAPRFAKALAGQLDFAVVFNAPVIRRRIEAGMSPEARQAMAGMWSDKPTLRRAALEWGMEKIAQADAMFTTFSAAIAYDYHFNEATRAGMDEATARAIAMEQTEKLVARTSQPVEMMDRSLFELGLSPMGKLGFMFMSEARQKSAYALEAYLPSSGLTRAERTRRIVLLHVLTPILIQTVSNAWRDARDDDDDDVFDERNWTVKGYLAAMVLGPLSGVPLVGSFLGNAYGDMGVVGQLWTAGRDIKSIIEDDAKEPWEKAIKATASTMKAIGQALGGDWAIFGAAANVVRDLFGLADNAQGKDR